MDECHVHNIRFVVASTNLSESFESTKELFYNVATLILFLVIVPRVFTVSLWWNSWFMSVGSGQRASLITFVCSIHQKRNAIEVFADCCYWDSPFGGVVTNSAGQVNFNDDLIICGYHMKLGVPSAPRFPNGLLSEFFKAQCPSGCTLQDVLSMASTSICTEMISCACSAAKILWSTPFLAQRLNFL